MIEARFLASRKRQLAAQKSFPGHIDMSAAAHMHLHEEIYPEEFWCGYDRLIRDTAIAYPSLHSESRSLESAFADALKRWTGCEFDTEEVVAFPGGVYGAYSPVLAATGRAVLLVPESMHQTHKTCFALTVADIREVPMDTAYLLDLNQLDAMLASVPYASATVFIHHNRGPAFDRGYFLRIAETLARHGAVAIYDADTIATSHDGRTRPSLPLEVSEFMRHALVLCNMTKEYGLPGIRIGFGVGNRDICTRIHHHMKAELRMLPPVTRAIAERALGCADLSRSSTILHERLQALVEHFRRLGWPNFRTPAHGINVFVPVPPSFARVSEVPPDELFYYWCLSRAGVLLRPGSIYGPLHIAEVRPTLSLPVANMEKAFERLESVGLRYDMPLPERIVGEYEQFIARENF